MLELTPDAETRVKRAEMIIAHPLSFWVCEGCESIVLRDTVFCPLCHGYHFDHNPRRVQESARILGSRPRTMATISWE